MKPLSVILIAACCAVAALSGAVVVGAEKARFDNYRIYSVKIATAEQLRLLQDIDMHLDGYQFWSYPSEVGMTVQMMVPPHKFSDFAELQETHGFETDLLIANLQEKMDNEQPKFKPRTMSWAAYYRLDEIYSWFDDLAAAYPDKVTLVEGGSSYEGRKIRGLIYATNPNNPGVFIESGMHAREWIGPATSTYILNQLLTSNDASIKAIAEKYNWYIFPVANPDGYEYTHTTNRNWRKTRSVTSGCFGADPNRNWGYNWMQGGASSNPCSDTFAGSSAFSEIETRSLSNYYSTIADKISTYISFHAYGQMMLLPYGHTTAHLGNYDDLMLIGQKSLATLKARHGTAYTIGNIAETIYIASGGSIDWIKGEKDTGLVYCYELRDLGSNGFTLPANQIIPTGQETLDSIVTMLAEGAKLGYH